MRKNFKHLCVISFLMIIISTSTVAANDQIIITIDGIPSEYNGKVGMAILDTGGSGKNTQIAFSMPTTITNSVSTNYMLDWANNKPFGKDGTYMIILDISESSAKGAPTLYTGVIISRKIDGNSIVMPFSQFMKL